MSFQPLHTEQDYHDALKLLSALVDQDPAPDTPDGDRLAAFAALVEEYEGQHFPLDCSSKPFQEP
jgi:HTH-type transcriptional regulator/antitoxin HigA